MEFLQYDFLQRAWLAGMIIAVLCPVVGMFVVVRRQSLIGDGLGHLAFAGVAAGHLLGWYPLAGALGVTTLGALAIEQVRRLHRQFSDMALALFFYSGIALAVIFSSMSHIPSAGLLTVLFGSILTVSYGDIAVIAGCGVFILGSLYLVYPKLLLLSLDEDIAVVAGVRNDFIGSLFSILTALVVVAGMSVVGILMVSALMIVPVATAHSLDKSFRVTLLWSIVFAMLAVAVGLLLAFRLDIAPGGTIVLCAIVQYLLLMAVKLQKKPAVDGENRR